LEPNSCNTSGKAPDMWVQGGRVTIWHSRKANNLAPTKTDTDFFFLGKEWYMPKLQISFQKILSHVET